MSEEEPLATTVETTVDLDDWATLQGIQYLRDHWSDPEWPATRKYLSWYALFADEALARLVRDLQTRLADVESLDLVPTDALHMTIQGVDYLDRLTEDQVDAIALETCESCRGVERFTIQVGPIAGYAGGAFLRATPWAPLYELKARVLEGVRAVLGPTWQPKEPSQFKPHITISYCHAAPGTVSAKPLIERLAAMRDIKPISLEIGAVELLVLRRERNMYRWDTVGRVSLG
jgi:2'-5' RNA ligase